MRSHIFGRGAASAVEDATSADFDEKVVRRSANVPVVVDFWAPWCGPCRMLGPTLERLAAEAKGDWVLVKVNTDENQGLAQQYGIQGIPAVKAFREGKVVAEFVGAQPEPVVRQFVAGLAPSAADRLVKNAHKREMAGDLETAESGYREALAQQADHPAALVGLGRVLFARDRYEEAARVLDGVPQGSRERAEADTWLAQARFRAETALTGGEMEARRRVAANPGDTSARLALAGALAARGAYREALEGLLGVLEAGEPDARNQARESMLAIFRILGDQHELTQEYRPRLASLLW